MLQRSRHLATPERTARGTWPSGRGCEKGPGLQKKAVPPTVSRVLGELVLLSCETGASATVRSLPRPKPSAGDQKQQTLPAGTAAYGTDRSPGWLAQGVE